MPFPNIEALYRAECEKRGVNPKDGLEPGAWKTIITTGIPGYGGTDGELAEAFLEMDTDKNSRLTFEEFVTCMTKPHLDVKKMNEVDALFKKWDKSGDSKLSKEEIRAAAANYRDDTIERICKSADTDGDGFISVAEFKKELFGKA